MRTRAMLSSLSSVSFVAIIACGGDPIVAPVPLEGVDVVMRFCSAATPPSLVAYQGDGGTWTVVPVVNRSASFKAMPKGVVMMVRSSTSGRQIQFLFASAAELALYDTSNDCGLSGGKSLSGSVANVAFGPQQALVQMGDAVRFVLGPATTFTISNVRDGPLDLVALRRGFSDATPSNRLTEKVIIRRATDLAAGATMPVLDFDAAEAFTPVTHSVSISGQGSDDFYMDNYLLTAAGTWGHLLDYNFFTGTAPLISLPAANLEPGDIHQLILYAAPLSLSEFRGIMHHYRNAGDKSLSLGPRLPTPSVTVSATAPYLRHRFQLASQVEYPDVASLFVQQGTKSVVVRATRGYFGGTPTTWDVTVPDVSSVAGFQVSWMPAAGVATTWDVEADAAPLPWFFGADAEEGTTLKFATRSSPSSSVVAARQSGAVATSCFRARMTDADGVAPRRCVTP